MWFLSPAAGIAVIAILALASDSEKQARKTWGENFAAAQRSVEEHRLNIERQISGADASYDFHFLNDLYHSSFRVADHAYALLENARDSLSGLKRMINATELKRRELKEKFNERMSRTDYSKIISELNELRDLQFGLQHDFNLVLDQKRSLAEEVSYFNQQTMHLKEAIRDRCGERGRQWYQASVERANARRVTKI
jgi:hypothetical protein